MVRLSFDVETSDDIRAAPSDPKRVGAILLRAARYLRNREAMPDNLADWLADAFYSAGRKREVRSMTKALTDSLYLSYGSTRPKASWITEGALLESLVAKLGNYRKAFDSFNAQRPADKQLEESTLKTYLKKYRAAKKIHDGIL